MMAAAEVLELPALDRGHDHLAGVGAPNRRSGTRDGIGLVEDRRVALEQAFVEDPQLRAVPARDGRPVLRVGSAGDTYEVHIPCPANRTIRFALRFPRRVR